MRRVRLVARSPTAESSRLLVSRAYASPSQLSSLAALGEVSRKRRIGDAASRPRSSPELEVAGPLSAAVAVAPVATAATAVQVIVADAAGTPGGTLVPQGATGVAVARMGDAGRRQT